MNLQPGHNDLQALCGGIVIDGNGGRPIRQGVVLIEGARIAAVGDRTLPIPARARRVATAGKYIIPGLLDANVHLFFGYATLASLLRLEGRYDEAITEAAQVALRQGITTVFDTWGPREALTKVRDRIDRGEIPGSRIYLAGNIIGLGGPTSQDFLPAYRAVLSQETADSIDARWEQGVGPALQWTTREELRGSVRRYIEEAAPDFIKYASSGHALSHFSMLLFSGEAQRIIVEEAHRAGRTAQAHTTSPESLRLEIEAGADLLQHPDMTGPVTMPDSLLREIVTRRLPCAALLATRRFLAFTQAHGSEPMRTYHRIRDENDRRLIAAGGTLLLTTDGGVLPSEASSGDCADSPTPEDSPIELGQGHFRWIQAASELGMAPMDILMAATRNVARAYRVDGHLGTLEEGKYADLLLLDRDPLEDAQNYRHIAAVMKSGKFLDRESLPTHAVSLAK